MERVAFLIEKTGDRISAMLNPNTLLVRRLAGVRARRSANGILTGRAHTDDPLLYTGGGITELTLDLLFDVNVAGTTLETEDVRDLTKPFQTMAENVAGDDGMARPPLVTFIWGKAWNITGVVTAVAERLEFFTSEGAARRSRMRMRLRRTPEPVPAPTPALNLPPADNLDPPAELAPDEAPLSDLDSEAEPTQRSYQIIGGATSGEGDNADSAPNAPPNFSDRLDHVAQEYFGDPSLWRMLATFNRIADPLRLVAGQVLRIPDTGGQP